MTHRAQSHSSKYAAPLIRFHAIGVASATSLDEFRADADRSHVAGQSGWEILLTVYFSGFVDATWWPWLAAVRAIQCRPAT